MRMAATDETADAAKGVIYAFWDFYVILLILGLYCNKLMLVLPHPKTLISHRSHKIVGDER